MCCEPRRRRPQPPERYSPPPPRASPRASGACPWIYTSTRGPSCLQDCRGLYGCRFCFADGAVSRRRDTIHDTAMQLLNPRRWLQVHSRACVLAGGRLKESAILTWAVCCLCGRRFYVIACAGVGCLCGCFSCFGCFDGRALAAATTFSRVCLVCAGGYGCAHHWPGGGAAPQAACRTAPAPVAPSPFSPMAVPAVTDPVYIHTHRPAAACS